ncbi:uncharacterized protein LOC114523362 [Dendronephthya gigantea]|uniref:uncharacterized protein LOC114523362 n=1 Tax=Dendronephthya gigantea TaxID=151771 RepID=UPI00106C4EE1|nr:uncharacterized protein LOC114523362 [Dendronephthya gigantea]
MKVIDCSTRMCNVERSQSSKRSCQQCKDLENCYNKNVLNNTTVPGCYDWNEIKCAKGFVQKNYDDKSRINHVELISNVKLVNSDELVIYGCPNENNLIVVTKKDRVNFKRRDIISSTQAEGIFHKIQEITFTNQHAIMNVIPARVEDVISNSDFDQEVPLQKILDQDLLENSPDDSLLQDVLSGDAPINKTIKVHTISSGHVYKCLAKTYTTDKDEEVTTLFVVFPMTTINGNLSIGNVIVGSTSNGFLETVKEIVQDEGINFIYTELMTCKTGFSNSTRYKTLNKATSSCLGGDDLLGLKITEHDTNVTVGDIIVGRDSGSFFGKVISFYAENGNYFAELMPISNVKDGDVQEQYNVSEISSRRRRAVGSLTTGANFIMARSEKIGPHLKVSGSVQFNANVKINFHTSYLKPKSVGVGLSGGLKLDLNCDFNPSSSYSVSQVRKLINNKQVGRFCIPFVGAVCIPGVFRLDVGVSATASAKAASSLSASLTSKYSISAGGIWRKGHGVERIFYEFQKGSAIPSFKAHMENKYASFLVTLTPSFQVHWPSVIPRKLKHQAATFLKRIFDVKRGTSIPSLFVFTLKVPLTTTLDAKFCTEKCPDAGQNIEANFRGGVPKVTGSLTLNIGSYNKNWNLFTTSLFERAKSECFFTPVKVPCCITNGKPGKVDPKTGQCDEECDCYSGDPTAPKGIKMKDGTCKCEKCPDNSMKRKRSKEKPECPCLCKDGTEKVMNSDGSCHCACACDDGSKDTIAWDGSCPCECSCNGYEKSTLGPFGCKCEDRCPVCKDGEEPVWIDRKCLCRKKNSCGVPPVCVNGRKGPDCNQPNCSPCQGCSGNGVCITDSSCGSRCSCRRRWQGRCCERRRPVRWFGDPHLQTLDGMEFDYFGIGEYWHCKSIVNDFGMQVRFFGYKGASLTGAVALKVAEDIVTITTLPTSSYGDMPKLRINGVLQSLSNHDPKFLFANDSIKLNIFNPDNRTESDGVAIFAFQFKSGVTVTVEAEYSPVMSRQYLNVNFIPTAAFTKTTEGLCGFMDDDETNDLIGPKGEQYYNNTIKFSESWRITANHDGSGLVGSWDWNSSNFYIDDIMDPSYTDEGHTPLYSLDNFPLNQVNEAKRICKENGLENVILNNCVFDILMTNDTSFADQQSLQIGCPNDCTGKGLCKNATCSCLEGWSGDDCSIGSCGNCSRGSCVEGFCQCHIGWEGAECDRKATCFAVDNCTSEIHGLCKTTDICECNVGYTGSNCSVVAICIDVLNCSSNGDCIAVNVCKCHNGYNGSSCNKPSCESLGYCSGNGQCIAFDTCDCNVGWSGPSCSIPDCNTVNQCSNNGECVGPNICKCFEGYQGNDCTARLDCSHLNNCSGNGVCGFNNAATEDSNICSCYLGYAGTNCTQYDCTNVNDCSGNGTCVQPNLCSCKMGFEGETCVNFSCETRNRCSGNGACVGYEECHCNKNWIGLSCETPTCDGVNNCSFNGLCVFPNKCECYAEYDGRNCTEKVAANLNTPMFLNKSYVAVVAENRAKGFVILKVHANDIDIGRSGMVSYTIEGENFVLMNHDTGEISVAADGVFDYESQRNLTFIVKAADNGTPIRSSEANVTIIVKDENDNCPEFSTPAGNYKFPVQILASDDDSGDNGRIRYSITYESDPDQKFFITSNGTVLPRIVLQPGAYLLTIVAEDMGAIPCARKLSLTIVVDRTVSAVVLPTSIISSSSIELSPLTSTTTVGVGKQSSSDFFPGLLASTSTSLSHASTKALRPTSSRLPSSVAQRLHSTILSSTPSLQSSQPPKNGTSQKAYSTVSLSFVDLQPSSSPLLSANSIIESLSKNSIAVYPTQTDNSATLIMSTDFTRNKKLVSVKLKILNVVFVMNYREKNSLDYKNLRRRVEAALKIVFEKISGYLAISDIDFDEGSVFAKIQAEFSSENTQVSTSTLARAVVDATDKHGNLGDFRHNTSFLQQQITPTKPPTEDEGGDEGGDGALIGTAVGIGSAGLVCLILALCLVYYFKIKRTKTKHLNSERSAIEMNSAHDTSYYDNDIQKYN